MRAFVFLQGTCHGPLWQNEIKMVLEKDKEYPEILAIHMEGLGKTDRRRVEE